MRCKHVLINIIHKKQDVKRLKIRLPICKYKKLKVIKDMKRLHIYAYVLERFESLNSSK